MNQNEKYQTVETMRKFGGSFVAALANAYAVADSNNSARVEAAFPDYIKEYGPSGRFHPQGGGPSAQ